MGARKGNQYRLATPSYKLDSDVKGSTTRLSNALRPKKANQSTKNNSTELKSARKHHTAKQKEGLPPIPKELKNNNKQVLLTRIERMYNKQEIYNFLRDISTSDISDGIYFSRFQIYKQCKNVINSERSVILKSDDSKFVTLSRLNLLKEITCYIFSLINPDVLNFDENGNFINDFVENNIQQICEWERNLRYSLILDGFFQAIDELILEKDSKYNYDYDSAIDFDPELENIVKHIGNSDINQDNKFQLLKYLSFTIIFYRKYFKAIDSKIAIKKINEFITPEIFVSRNHKKRHINGLLIAYKEWIIELKKWEENHSLDRLRKLLNLYHLNRFTHIIDMLIMKKYPLQDIFTHRLGGLFTPIVITQIFEENNKLIEKYNSEYSTSKYDVLNKTIPCNSVNENSSQRNITERDIVFIKNIINCIYHTFNESILVKISKKKLIHDYKKACEYFEDFSKDPSLNNFLDKCDFIETIEELNKTIKSLDEETKNINIDEIKDYYQKVYDDLCEEIKE